MPNLRANLFDGRPLLDIASYGRRGPGRRDRLTSAELAQIASRVVQDVSGKLVPVMNGCHVCQNHITRHELLQLWRRGADLRRPCVDSGRHEIKAAFGRRQSVKIRSRCQCAIHAS